MPDAYSLYDAIHEAGVLQERERVLALTRNAIAADGDGRDLVVRADIIRKIENPDAPCFGKDPNAH